MGLEDDTYGTVEGIERLIGDIILDRTFSESTTPSIAQVEAELDAAAAELNRELDQVGYTVPVSVTDYPIMHRWMASMNNYGAAAVLLNIGPANAYESDEDQEGGTPTRAQTYANRFKGALKAIRENRLRAGRRKNRLADVYSGSQEDSDGNEKLPIFKRGEDDYPGRRSLVNSS